MTIKSLDFAVNHYHDWIYNVENNPENFSPDVIDFINETKRIIEALDKLAEYEELADKLEKQIMNIPGIDVYIRYWGNPLEMSIGGRSCYMQDKIPKYRIREKDDNTYTWPPGGLIGNVSDFIMNSFTNIVDNHDDIIITPDEFSLLRQIANIIGKKDFPIAEHWLVQMCNDDIDTMKNGYYRYENFISLLLDDDVELSDDLLGKYKIIIKDHNREFSPDWPFISNGSVNHDNIHISKQRRLTGDYGFEKLYEQNKLNHLSSEARKVLDTWKFVRDEISKLHDEYESELNLKWRNGLKDLSLNCRDFKRFCRMWGEPELILSHKNNWEYTDGYFPDCLLVELLYPSSSKIATHANEEETKILQEFKNYLSIN